MSQDTAASSDLSLRPHYSTGRIHEIWSDGDAPLGFVVNGRTPGPKLLVMGGRAECLRPFWRLLIDPRTTRIRGRLILLFIDDFDDAAVAARRAEAVVEMADPLAGTLLMPFDGALDPAKGVARIKSFCRQHGVMVEPVRRSAVHFPVC